MAALDGIYLNYCINSPINALAISVEYYASKELDASCSNDSRAHLEDS